MAEVCPAAPAEKKQKYDRQLRIWGENGQAALEAAHVCLINGGCLGTEIFKNLVLPGIGAITVVDGRTVSAEDLGSNFFVTQAHIGQPRAQVTAEMLQELNEDVDASKFVSEDPAQLISRSPEFFDSFTAVVATQLADAPLQALGARCWEKGVPLVLAKICGFVGYTRIVLPELPIVESKPENVLHDLRIPCPFTELQGLSDAVDVDVEDSTEHSHIPWIFILLKTLEQWRAMHSEAPAGEGREGPSNIKQKREFKALVKAQNRGMEENFEEALSQAHYAYTHPSVPAEVQAILDDPCCTSPSPQSSAFWVAAQALRTFVGDHGALPLAGGIPDMTAATVSYIALQQAYQEKAKADMQEVHATAQKVAQHQGCAPPSEEFIATVCKNAAHLRLKRFKSVGQEFDENWAQQLVPLLDGSCSFDGSVDKNVIWYLMLRSAENFLAKHGRHAGCGTADAPTTDVPLLRAEYQALLEGSSGLGPTEIEICMRPLAGPFGDIDPVVEMCRVGGAELHSTGALLGGMVSQELIKVLTAQFVPVDGGFLMNLMDNTATVIPF